MNWNNIDLTNERERDLPLLDEYTFDTLLLEVSCNVREITRETVRAQFEESLCRRITETREIFNNNLDNIVKQAISERNNP